jgi:hypothetical protein
MTTGADLETPAMWKYDAEFVANFSVSAWRTKSANEIFSYPRFRHRPPLHAFRQHYACPCHNGITCREHTGKSCSFAMKCFSY